MAVRTANRRSARWGNAAPATDDDARRLLVEAAARCFASFSPQRTTMDDIAVEASVHRTTVYKYFANREEIVAAVLFSEADGILADAVRLLGEDGPFAERVVAAFRRTADGVQGSTLLRRMFDPASAQDFVTITEGSDEFHRQVAEVLAPMVADARAELRPGLTVDEVVDWLARAAVMLLGEVLRDGDLDVAHALERYVLPGVLRSG